MASKKVNAADLRPGMKIWFSGSVWTVAELREEEGELRAYGTGGFALFGRAVNPVWLATVRYKSGEFSTVAYTVYD
jgi:hypothetical protein